MQNFLLLMVNDCEKAPLDTTIGAIEQQRLRVSVSVRAGSGPGDRFLLKPEKEKRDCFMDGKERNTHTHIHILADSG